MTLSQLLGPEPNPFVAKAKHALAAKFSRTRMQALFEVVELGWYLAALDRPHDACALLDEVADPIVFTGNFNLWTPVANAICLSARCTPNPARRKQLLTRLVKNPPLGELANRRQFGLVVGHFRSLIDEAKAARGTKAACALLAQGLQGLSFFEQTAGLGLSFDAWLDREGLTDDINRALAELACRLR